MNIQHKKEEKSGTFFMEENGAIRAEMTYRMRPDNIMVINHTEVDEELRGKDIGQQLVKTAVEYSREQGLKILPVCSFAAAVFERTKEYSDLLVKG